MPKALTPLLAVLLALAMVAAACGDDGGGVGDDSTADDTTADDTTTDDGIADDGVGDDSTADDTSTDDTTDIDYEGLGLWDDGPCDESMDPLVVGIMTVFESPVVSLVDQAKALDASAEAFNARGGANGACVQVVSCDDGANFDQALQCVREMEDSGVVATLNDQGSTAQADVTAAMADAGIPRIGTNVVNDDWGDQNAFPIDASGTGVTFLMPQALIAEGITDFGVIRVALPEAGQLVGLFGSLYPDATFPVDLPVPSGTTDYSQFILAAEDGGVGGVILALGEQEAVQVIRAAGDLGTDLPIGASLGTFGHANLADFGDIGGQMMLMSPFPPATADVPVYEVLRADLAASGEDELQPLELKTSPMRSWIALYALLYMLRDAGMTDFSSQAITTVLQEAENVPMLGIFGGEDWTPNRNREGLWQRVGVANWGVWRWDPAASFDGNEGNFVLSNEVNFDEVMCGSIFGAEGPC